MIGMENRTLHSQNLTFRLLRQEDKPFLYPILQEPETTCPAGFPPVGTEEAFERFWNDLTQYNTAVAILLEEISAVTIKRTEFDRLEKNVFTGRMVAH